jgi:parallel beta-helix repeat protein
MKRYKSLSIGQTCLVISLLGALVSVSALASSENVVSGKEAIDRGCSDTKLKEIYEKGRGDVTLDCNLTLDADKVVTRRLIIEGEESSHIDINCSGSRLNRGLIVRSRIEEGDKTTPPTWSVPSHINIRNCVSGSILHVHGNAINGEGAHLTESSRLEGHTERTQHHAPHHIHFSQIKTDTTGAIPFYFGPGVTHSSIQDSHISGLSKSVAIYLDAESAHNLIANNRIDTDAARELIAVDGSAHNRIINNDFNRLNRGGIYLYRNCGEGGNIRHQAPQYNLIEGNRFFYKRYLGRKPAVWLASRNGNRNYCDYDEGYDIGSSASDMDFARHNKVINNTFIRRKLIRMDDQPNEVSGNEVIDHKRFFGLF